MTNADVVMNGVGRYLTAKYGGVNKHHPLFRATRDLYIQLLTAEFLANEEWS